MLIMKKLYLTNSQHLAAVSTELLTLIEQKKTVSFYEDCSNETHLRNLCVEQQRPLNMGPHVHGAGTRYWIPSAKNSLDCCWNHSIMTALMPSDPSSLLFSTLLRKHEVPHVWAVQQIVQLSAAVECSCVIHTVT
jgi:hypothetical protein